MRAKNPVLLAGDVVGAGAESSSAVAKGGARLLNLLVEVAVDVCAGPVLGRWWRQM